MTSETTYRAGSRKSQLALIQTDSVVSILKKINPDFNMDIIAMTTKGDNVLDKPLAKVGKNVFTKELEEKLSDNGVDVVVHSLKDVSTALPTGLVIGAVLEREDPRDAVVTKAEWKGVMLKDLPKDSVIGTSSLRRAAQLRRKYPHLVVRDIRGNLNTRLQKLDNESGEYAAIVLALAGIRRMGWEDRVTEILSPDDMLYAVGQGALAVECRSSDRNVLGLLEPLSHCDTTLRVIAERSFMQTLGGGCTAPLAVNSTLESSTITLTGGVWRLDGSNALIRTMSCTFEEQDEEEPPRKSSCKEMEQFTGIASQKITSAHLISAKQLGVDLATKLIKLGASEIIEEAKREVDGPILLETNGNHLTSS